MKHDVAVRHQSVDERRVADIGFDDAKPFPGRIAQIFHAPAHHVVDHGDVRGTLPQQLINQVRADEAGTPRHQRTDAVQREWFWFGLVWHRCSTPP